MNFSMFLKDQDHSNGLMLFLGKAISSDTIHSSGIYTIRADSLSLLVSAAFLNSPILMFPLESVPTETIFIPHIAALAGFVP